MHKRIALVAVTGLLGLALAGCGTSPKYTDGVDWGQVAAGTGQIIAGSKLTKDIDPRVAQVSAQLARYCPMLQVAAAVGTASIPENKRSAGLMAQAALNEVCANLPADVPAAVIVAQKAVAAAQAAKLPTAAPS
jgi:hypothetical protein